MTNSYGKHLLVDCYGCKTNQINNLTMLNQAVSEAIENADMDIYDISIHQNDEALVLNAVGLQDHICIHSYPDYQYLAIDIYTFNTGIDPTYVMRLLRHHFRPDKIRATSIKRGKVDIGDDMKPKVNSKTTTLRKVKSTGQQIKRTGGKVLKALRKKKEASAIEKDFYSK